jgi:hypothetical protein
MSMVVTALTYLCHEMKREPVSVFFLKGGCVRDMLLNEAPLDIDITIFGPSSKLILLNFKKMLRATDVMVDEVHTKRRGVYSNDKLTIRHPTGNIVLDITLQRADAGPTEKCDFTCNNLIFRPDGSLSTRVSKPSEPVEWFSRCMRDCLQRRLDLMELPKPPHQIRYLQLYARQEKMLDKGFVFRETSTMLRPIKPHDKVDTCPICHDNYSASRLATTTCVLSCSHHYHTTCIRESMEYGRKTCPVCRVSINLQLKPEL